MFADIAAGFREQGAEDMRSRREMAQAFNEFKSANPEATLAEFQSFIDQMSGGRNYLRGGAPSRQVLEGISKENQTRRAERKAQERLAAARSRAEFRGQLEAQIDDALLNMDGDDYGAAIATFTESMGGDLGGLDIAGMFTPQRRQRAIMGQLAQSWPTLSSLIAETDGEIDAATLSQMSGMPLPVAEAAVKKHQQAAERETQTYMQRRRADLIAAGVDALNNGTDPAAAIAALAGDEGMTLPDEFIGNLSAEAERRRGIEEQDRERELRREIMRDRQAALAYITERATSGDDVRKFAAEFFELEPDAFPNELVAGLIQDFEREKQRKEEDRKRVEAQAVADAKQKVLTPMLEPGRLTHFAEADDARAAIARQVDLQISLLTPEQQKAITPADREAMAQTVIDEAQIAQDRRREQRRLEAQAAAVEAAESVVTDSQRFVDDNLRTLPGDAQRIAALDLADEFLIDGEALGIIADAVIALGEGDGVNAATAADAARKALTAAGVPTLKEARQDAQNLEMRKAGVLREDEEFSQYLRSAEEDVSEMRDGSQDQIAKALKLPPEERVVALMAIRAKLERDLKNIEQGIEIDRANVKDVITTATDRWDDTAVTARILTPARRVLTTRNVRIDRLLAKAEDEAARAEADRVAQLAPKDGGKPRSDRTPAQAAVERATDHIDGLGAMGDARRAAGPQFGFGWIKDWATMSEEDYEAQKRAVAFASDDGVRNEIRNNPELAGEMAEHPGGVLGWAEDNADKAWVKAWLEANPAP